MIRKYTDDIELRPGMFINCEGVMYDSFAGTPREILEVKPKSVLTRACLRPEEGAKQKLKRLIQWVCDTEAEARAMAEASNAYLSEAFRLKKELAETLSGLRQSRAQAVMDRFSGGA